MLPGLIVLALLAAVVIALVLTRLKREQHQQRAAVRQVRESKLYAHVYPLLLRCQEQRIEQVTLTRDALTIRLFAPAGRVLTYHFERHGFHPIPEDRLYPLAQALAVDLKPLSDPRMFTFCSRELLHANGDKEPYYQYNIVTAYKDKLQRNLYAPRRKGA